MAAWKAALRSGFGLLAAFSSRRLAGDVFAPLQYRQPADSPLLKEPAMSYDPNQQQPYQTYGSPPPPQRGSGMKIVWIVLGVLGVLGLLCCGGFTWFGSWIMGVGAEAIAKQVEHTPAMQDHIGKLESASMNLVATGEYAQKHRNEKNVAVIDVTGSKGSGQLLVKTGPGNSIEWAKLRLDSGEEFDLVGGNIGVGESGGGESGGFDDL
jgi:hypothetical protein